MLLWRYEEYYYWHISVTPCYLLHCSNLSKSNLYQHGMPSCIIKMDLLVNAPVPVQTCAKNLKTSANSKVYAVRLEDMYIYLFSYIFKCIPLVQGLKSEFFKFRPHDTLKYLQLTIVISWFCQFRDCLTIYRIIPINFLQGWMNSSSLGHENRWYFPLGNIYKAVSASSWQYLQWTPKV